MMKMLNAIMRLNVLILFPFLLSMFYFSSFQHYEKLLDSTKRLSLQHSVSHDCLINVSKSIGYSFLLPQTRHSSIFEGIFQLVKRKLILINLFFFQNKTVSPINCTTADKCELVKVKNRTTNHQTIIDDVHCVV